MKNYAWVNFSNGVVENIIYYDGVTPIQLPEGIILIQIPENGIKGQYSMLSPGWKYINNQFVEPPEPPQPEPPAQPVSTGAQVI